MIKIFIFFLNKRIKEKLGISDVTIRFVRN